MTIFQYYMRSHAERGNEPRSFLAFLTPTQIAHALLRINDD